FKTLRVGTLHASTHQKLHRIVGEETHFNPLLLEEHLQTLTNEIIGLEEEYVRKMAELPVKKRSYKRELLQRLLIAENYLQDHRYGSIKLNELAQACNLSPYYLHRLFRQVFGSSPAEYQERLRMTEAKKKLPGATSVKAVAYALGYSDEGYFSRRFKKFHGFSPSACLQAKQL
ncbi:MAG: AraC family transcriptional regulator, partial [Bacteroidota bacterium]